MSSTGKTLVLVLAALGGVVILGAVVLVSCGVGGYLLGARVLNANPGESSQLAVGAPAPDFQMTTIYGETMHLSDLRAKAVMLNFWATWCGPCVEEMPTLQSYFEKYDQELVIIGVNADEPRSDVVDFTEDNSLTFPVVLDPDSRIQDLYHIRGYPTSYFIDAQGVIRAVHVGSLSGALLDEYLAEIGVGK